jgi:hypothetical protein
MSSTDLGNLSNAVTSIQIDGPTSAPAEFYTRARVELTEESVLQVLPGELDPAVGSQPQPVTSADIAEEFEKVHREQEASSVSLSDALFNPHVYDTTPVLDGQSTDTIQIALGGGIKLEASDEDAQALFTALRLGRWVDLRVSGFVASKHGSYKEDKDGESQVAGKVTVKAVDVSLIRPEDL